jgi:acetyltransferase-like isoleucine patch superfamily enzyme
MGAGAVTSNVKSDKSLVTIAMGKSQVRTSLKKLGAVLGDHVEVGCGTVLNPGTVIGRGSRIYPLSSVRGVVAGNSIYKRAGEIAPIR